jgi:hypothetical protein
VLGVDLGDLTPEDREAVSDVLGNEYAVLMSALNSAWSASLTRTSIFSSGSPRSSDWCKFNVNRSFTTRV